MRGALGLTWLVASVTGFILGWGSFAFGQLPLAMSVGVFVFWLVTRARISGVSAFVAGLAGGWLAGLLPLVIGCQLGSASGSSSSYGSSSSCQYDLATLLSAVFAASLFLIGLMGMALEWRARKMAR